MDYSPLQPSLRDVLIVVFKRKWSILGLLTVAMLAAVVWLWFIREPLYTVSAKILVKIGHEQSPPATLVGANPQVIGYRYQEVNSEVEILQSTELMARVVDELHLDQPSPSPPVPTEWFARLKYEAKKFAGFLSQYADELLIRWGLRERLSPRDKVINALQKGLVVRGQKDSNVFVAELTLPFRAGSSIVLNRLLDHYMKFRVQLYRAKGVDFFQRGVDRTAGALRKTEEALQQYESAGNISVLEKQQEDLVTQIGTAEAVARESQRIKEEAASKVRRLDEEMRKPDPNLGALGEFDKDSLPSNLLRQMAELQKERERLRMTELDNSDRVQNNRNQFKVLADMLGANLRSTLAEKEADYRSRSGNLATLQAQLNALHNRQMDWEAYKRQSKEDEEMYLFYRRKYEEASAMAAQDEERFSNVTIIQPALDPVLPSSVRRTTLLGVCFVVAVLACLAWISLAEFFDHGLYTAEALEKFLAVPVLGVIPVTRRPLAALARLPALQPRTGAHGG